MAPGTSEENPLRVAVVGSGPSGFFVAAPLLKARDRTVEVDMFDRLWAPYGLVRYGVAPDHQKIKRVVKGYAATAAHPAFRFFGGVELGRDITLEEMRQYYHQIVLCTGAQTDRRLGIPGEDLAGSHPATEFVAWYNGHPDYRDLEFDLSAETAVVVGVGNVAVDVARILARTPEELARTDIADHALEALRDSRIRQVHLLGRRGPAQAAFTNTELVELGKLDDADCVTRSEEVELDAVTRADLEANPSTTAEQKVEVLQAYARPIESPKSRQLVIRFLVSPTELVGDSEGRVQCVRLVHNELVAEGGRIRSVSTDRTEEIEAGLVFRSVGYRGIPVPGAPFRDDWGIIPNEEGRVTDPETGEHVRDLYVSGWIKRGPSGVIGTNKPDAVETVKHMLADVDAGRLARDSVE